MAKEPKSDQAAAGPPGQREDRWRERIRRQQRAIVRLATSEEMAKGDRASVLALATEVGADALLIARCSVWFLEDEDHSLHCHDLFEPNPDQHSSGTRLAADEYPSYFSALRSGRAIDAHDAVTDVRTSEFARGYLDKLGISSMMDAAIRVDGRVVGVVCCEHVGEPRVWQPDEISFAGELADQVAHLIIGDQRRQAVAERDSMWMQLSEVERLQTIGTLAAGIAHDFNNILTPILAHAELAQLSLDEDDPLVAHLQPIVENATKARVLVRQLLTVGRPEARSSTGNCDLRVVAEEVISLARASFPSSIIVRTEFESEVLPAALDDSQAHQVLLNLVVNAALAIGDDGGELRIVLGRVHDRDGIWAVAEVSDTGVGMDKSTLDRIFEPFFTTRSAGEGSGLGLAVVYGIVKSCGGRIDVHSEPGKGSRFRVRFPLAGGLDAQLRKEKVDATPSELKLLLVEDDPAVAGVLQAQLRRAGHVVTICSSPKVALELFSRDPSAFDGVLSDHTMPAMSGSELLRALREIRSDLPTVLMSGLELDAAEHSDYVDVVLLKPLRFAELEHAIRRISPPA